VGGYLALLGKSERKRPLKRPRCRWKDNIGIDLREIAWEGVDFRHVAQGRDQWQALVNTVMNFKIS
jgi:hypothetical protein